MTTVRAGLRTAVASWFAVGTLVACVPDGGKLSGTQNSIVETDPAATSAPIVDPYEEWSRFSVLFDRPHLRSPLEVDGEFYGIADVRDVVPDLETRGDVIVLLRFDGTTFVPLDRYGGGVCFLGDCDFIYPAFQGLDLPVFRVSFLRTATDGSRLFPNEEYFLSIVDGDLVSLLPIGSTASLWEPVDVVKLIDFGVVTRECSLTDWFVDESGISQPWCQEYLERRIQFDVAGPVVVEESRIPNPKPIEACLFSYGENCANSVSIYADPGCPAPKEGELYEYAIYPCTYSFWVLVAETELVDMGYLVEADGYYRSTEIEIVKRAQSDFGVTADGRIGRESWKTMFASLDCRTFDLATGEPSNLEFCYDDWNNDGFYGPGDLIPD